MPVTNEVGRNAPAVVPVDDVEANDENELDQVHQEGRDGFSGVPDCKMDRTKTVVTIMTQSSVTTSLKTDNVTEGENV